MRICLVALCLGLTAQLTETEDGPIPKEKWKSDYTEKTWGLKLKTVKYTINQQPPNVYVVHVNVLFEFTKDDLKPEEVKALRGAFYTKKEEALEFCFIDKDGVIFAKVPNNHYVIEGDLSGRKGDVIRCKMSPHKTNPLQFMDFPESVKKVSKVELRPPSPK